RYRFSGLLPNRPDMEEQRKATPTRVLDTRNGVGRLSERIDDEPGLLERTGVHPKRPVVAVKDHGQAVALDLVRVTELLEVRPSDQEDAVGRLIDELPCRIDWVHDRHAKPSAWYKRSGRFENCAVQIVDVVQRHERDGEISAGIPHWQVSDVRENNRLRLFVRPGKTDEGL